MVLSCQEVSNYAKSQEEMLIMSLFFVLASTGIAKYLNLSPLLSGMMIGAVHVNLNANPNRMFSVLNQFTPPIHLLPPPLQV